MTTNPTPTAREVAQSALEALRGVMEELAVCFADSNAIRVEFLEDKGFDLVARIVKNIRTHSGSRRRQFETAIAKLEVFLAVPQKRQSDIAAFDERDETRRWLLEIGIEMGVPVQVPGDEKGEPHDAWKGLAQRIKAAVTKPPQEQQPDDYGNDVNATRWIAWAKRSASNGRITRWSRWHAAMRIIDGERTLCGEIIPHTKIETDHYQISEIKGGDCAVCSKAFKQLAEKRAQAKGES